MSVPRSLFVYALLLPLYLTALQYTMQFRGIFGAHEHVNKRVRAHVVRERVPLSVGATPPPSFALHFLLRIFPLALSFNIFAERTKARARGYWAFKA